ncbi:MAG TPA: response regulator [Chryseolinea sp.]|nr:response regulator [Chryseolinea sp.]
MMNQRQPIVALIDDDKIFQLTTLRMIQAARLAEGILQFENGEDALTFLKDNTDNTDTLPDYIFLDINMPLVDGWMFLEEFAIIKEALKKDVSIFMISSSIDPRDVSRARHNENVLEYISKPVSREKLAQLLQYQPATVSFNLPD